jgi:hypothetical protein
MNWVANIPRRLVSGLAELSPSCKKAARLQSEALDHKLTFRQQLGLRIHLALCKWCSRYGKQIAFIRAAAHARPDETVQSVPHKLSDEARERISKQICSAIKRS